MRREAHRYEVLKERRRRKLLRLKKRLTREAAAKAKEAGEKAKLDPAATEAMVRAAMTEAEANLPKPELEGGRCSAIEDAESAVRFFGTKAYEGLCLFVGVDADGVRDRLASEGPVD